MNPILTGLLLGLAGSFHCLAMCGPLALGVSAKYPGRGSLMGYHSARILTYMTLGLCAGILGIAHWPVQVQQATSLFMGALIILVVFLPAKFKRILQWEALVRWQTGLLRHLQMRWQPRGKIASATMLGAINGLLPCGLVWVAAGLAAMQVSWQQSSLLMLGFGLGTIPALCLVQWLAGRRLVAGLAKKLNWSRVAVLLISLLLLARGMGLDIPYVSPAGQPGTCCHRVD